MYLSTTSDEAQRWDDPDFDQTFSGVEMELHYAIERHDVERVKRCVASFAERNGDPRFRGCCGFSFLHQKITCGGDKTLELFDELMKIPGIDVNQTAPDDDAEHSDPALNYCGDHCAPKCAARLIRHPDHRFVRPTRVLWDALCSGDVDFVRAFLEKVPFDEVKWEERNWLETIHYHEDYQRLHAEWDAIWDARNIEQDRLWDEEEARLQELRDTAPTVSRLGYDDVSLESLEDRLPHPDSPDEGAGDEGGIQEGPHEVCEAEERDPMAPQIADLSGDSAHQEEDEEDQENQEDQEVEEVEEVEDEEGEGYEDVCLEDEDEDVRNCEFGEKDVYATRMRFFTPLRFARWRQVGEIASVLETYLRSHGLDIPDASPSDLLLPDRGPRKL